MSEIPRSTPEGPYTYSPVDVIARHFRGDQALTATELTDAGSIVRHSLDTGRDELGVCLDLVTERFTSATRTLANLFYERHSQLPDEWKDSVVATRALLAMVSHIELGLLRGLQAGLEYEAWGLPHALRAPHVTQLEAFQADLLERN